GDLAFIMIEEVKYSNTALRTCTTKNLYVFKQDRTTHKILIRCLLLLFYRLCRYGRKSLRLTKSLLQIRAMRQFSQMSGAVTSRAITEEVAMKKWLLAQVSLLAGLLLLSGCANLKQGEQNVISAGAKQEERKQKTSVPELRRLYDAAKSEYERRTVCLRAIDERTIHRGGEVSTVDAILGTHFSAELPANDSLRWNIVHFDSGAPGVYDERGWVKDSTESGWYLAIKSDWHGHILHYYLSNLHRNPSTLKPKREGREQKALILELKQLYETAKSEDERREVCLRAIDARIIYYLGPVSSVDAIFGTSYATNPPEAYQSLGYYGYITIGSRLPDMIDKRGRPLFGGFAGWEFGFY